MEALRSERTFLDLGINTLISGLRGGDTFAECVVIIEYNQAMSRAMRRSLFLYECNWFMCEYVVLIEIDLSRW